MGLIKKIVIPLLRSYNRKVIMSTVIVAVSDIICLLIHLGQYTAYTFYKESSVTEVTTGAGVVYECTGDEKQLRRLVSIRNRLCHFDNKERVISDLEVLQSLIACRYTFGEPVIDAAVQKLTVENIDSLISFLRNISEDEAEVSLIDALRRLC